MAATLKVHKLHTQNVCVRLVNGLHEPYHTLLSASMNPWATGLLALLKTLLKYQTGKSLKRANRLSSNFECSTIMAITTIQMRKNNTNHWVLHSLLIVIVELELYFSDSQTLRCYCSVERIRHFARIRLFIASTPLGSSTEHVF